MNKKGANTVYEIIAAYRQATLHIPTVVNNNKSQVKRSVELLLEELGKALHLDISP